MEKIIIDRKECKYRARYFSVVVSSETYGKVHELAREANRSVESVVDQLLNEALNNVEVR